MLARAASNAFGALALVRAQPVAPSHIHRAGIVQFKSPPGFPLKTPSFQMTDLLGTALEAAL
eukprot:12971951-Alexandrium_andersonii.AAC.1